ncbi:hypothetical protein [Acetobacter cerevisiae]|uniref:hypothetical protein n=1 Tax=Acetobacter cerevisiae TaxID=178900 RepID=UPI0012E70261|nr:hypothetical protein [Acetobacter cerevisiae]GBQ09047.1 hypothetical protein AA14362_2144 [Acetobacter cerevisiae DSM 14362]
MGDLWNNEDKRVYLNRLEEEGILPSENERLPEPKDSSNKPANTPRKNLRPSRPRQTTFIPDEAPSIHWVATQQRLRAVWGELQTLPLRKYPNAICALMRILVELSIESYIEKHNLSKADNLGRKFGLVSSHLLNHQRIDRSYYDELERIRLHDQLISIPSMQRYIHSPDFAPMENELLAYWARLGRFLIAILNH